MIDKNILLEQVSDFLTKHNYTVKFVRCFDIVAIGKNILLIKILKDANSLSRENAIQLVGISHFLNAVPLIIAEYSGEKLLDNVVYERFGIKTLTFETFKRIVLEKDVFFRSSKAGITLVIDSEALRRNRKMLKMSLSEVSSFVGVSRSMAYDYEKRDSSVTIQKAIKLYKLFGKSIFKPVNLECSTSFDFSKESKSIYSQKYNKLGFEAFDVKTDFDVIARKDEDVILTEIGDKRKLKSPIISSIFGSLNFVIFKKKKPRKVPSMNEKEFFNLETGEELINFVKSFDRR
ncbi:MAG: helix-turn-helix domain-containing protein [Candidatus Woesearchaeota archaeon]